MTDIYPYSPEEFKAWLTSLPPDDKPCTRTDGEKCLCPLMVFDKTHKAVLNEQEEETFELIGEYDEDNQEYTRLYCPEWVENFVSRIDEKARDKEIEASAEFPTCFKGWERLTTKDILNTLEDVLSRE